ncbi:MAG: hypothetical protein ACLFPD_06415 [Desulfosudaceae bacterium]
METIQDFEDILFLLAKHRARYLVVGGMAFIFHAKPRYTKDMDIWVDARPENVEKVNAALAEFGSPYFFSQPAQEDEILQLGVAPDRIDILLTVTGLDFDVVWDRRVVGAYGQVEANWIDLYSLIAAKKRLDAPRHQEDVRVLEKVKARLG